MLEGKDILQVDATVITGILILHTLAKLKPNEAERLAGWVAYTILPFAFSAVLILLSYAYSIENIPVSALFRAQGFALLSLILVWYFLVPLKKRIQKVLWTRCQMILS